MDQPNAVEASQIEVLCSGMNVDSVDIISALSMYAQELIRWQKIKNLVSRETLPEIWPRHFIDSLQLAKHINPADGILLDLGSGGGLPAIPLAIVFKNAELPVHMVEANGRKCSFLRHISRQLGLNCVVHNERVEKLQLDSNLSVGAITARGFADLDATFDYALPQFGEKTVALLQKGRGYNEEIAATKTKWRYGLETFSSVVEPDSVVLAISGLKRR